MLGGGEELMLEVSSLENLYASRFLSVIGDVIKEHRSTKV